MPLKPIVDITKHHAMTWCPEKTLLNELGVGFSATGFVIFVPISVVGEAPRGLVEEVDGRSNRADFRGREERGLLWDVGERAGSGIW